MTTGYTAAVVDSRNSVTIEGSGAITVQAVPAGAADELLRLNAILDGSNLRRVQDAQLTDTPLYLAEDAVKVGGAPATVDSIQFNLTAGVSVGVGEMAWNPVDGTFNLGLLGGTVVWQGGQEMPLLCQNETGDEIANGQAVYITDAATGTKPHIDLGLATSQDAALIVGVTTEAIANGTAGYVTFGGLVRGMDTSAIAAGGTAFLSDTVPGGLRATPVSSPDYKARVGTCIVQNATTGVLLVLPSTVPLLKSLSDVTITNPVQGDILVYQSGQAIYENKVPSYTYTQSFETYVPKATRGKTLHQHGGLDIIVSGGAVSSGSPQAFTNGLSKVLLVVNAGSDTTGSVTITGTSVDRDTGVETPADTEVMTIAGLTTDASDTDAQGNDRWSFANAYISSKWWLNGCTLSTTDTNISDLDMYAVAFEQFGDQPNVEVKGCDITALPTNGAAWFYGYMYSLILGTGNLCDISREITFELPATDVTADRRYRKKRAELSVAINGTTDGIWIELHFGPFNQTYWEDVNTKVWGRITEPLVLT